MKEEWSKKAWKVEILKFNPILFAHRLTNMPQQSLIGSLREFPYSLKKKRKRTVCEHHRLYVFE